MPSRDKQTVIARQAIEIDGALKGTVELASRVPIDITEKQREIDKSAAALKELAAPDATCALFICCSWP